MPLHVFIPLSRSGLAPGALDRIVRDLWDQFVEVGLEAAHIKGAMDAAQQLMGTLSHMHGGLYF
jgi:hypothetical protein